nr:unnamed protein product [Spirometra erinaceieuropaei]
MDRDSLELQMHQDVAVIETIAFSVEEVRRVLSQVKPDKSPGPHGIPELILKELSTELSKPLSTLFELSLRTGRLPSQSKTANLVPLHKGACLETWTRALEEGFEVDVVYIDFRKAFDTVPHQRLLHKLSDIGIRGDLLNWIRAFLVGRKRVCIGDDMSEWVNVTSGVPQGSVLAPLLFILYVNDSLQELDCGKDYFISLISGNYDLVCLLTLSITSPTTPWLAFSQSLSWVSLPPNKSAAPS